MGYTGVSYNPLTHLLLTCWDIQVQVPSFKRLPFLLWHPFQWPPRSQQPEPQKVLRGCRSRLPSLKPTTSLPPKMDGWNTIVSFWGPAYFQG